MNTGSPSYLTPEQAADVIRWHHNRANTNPETGVRYARDKVPLGLAALHLSMTNPNYFLPSMDEPALTVKEMSAGIKLLTAEDPSKALRTMSRLQVWGQKTQASLEARGATDAKGLAYKD